MRLCFATNNRHKVEEVKAVVGDAIQLITLEEAGIGEELPETQNTLEGNARQKALYVCSTYHLPCFADDTGLEVAALQGAPGVFSARYAGPHRNSEDNTRLLLNNLIGKSSRSAQFRTVISLILPQGEWLFEGVLKGSILENARGHAGFGYDPVFLPENARKSLAEMTLEEKNRISHRAVAIGRMAEFLRTL